MSTCAASSSFVERNSAEKGILHFESDSPKDEKASLVTSLPAEVVVSGILFSRSVRSSFASFTLAPLSWSQQDNNGGQSPKDPPILVRLQFMDNIKELRSFCRKQYKIGDKIEFLDTHKGRWEQSPSSLTSKEKGEAVETNSSTNETPRVPHNAEENVAAVGNGAPPPSWSQQPRWVVDLTSASQAEKSVVVCNSRVWSMKECQQHQLKYIKPRKAPNQQQEQPFSKKQKRANDRGAMENKGISAFPNDTDVNEKNTSKNTDSTNNHHGGGKEKRLQAQELIAFFVNLVGSKLVEGWNEKKEPPTLEQRQNHLQMVRDWFNRADGVLDVAGGCGHVSMALGMEGISSTVVDARATVGKLPKRDRKIWKRSLQNRPPRAPRIHFNGKKSDGDDNGNRPPTIAQFQTPQNPLSKYEYCQPVVPAPAVVPFQSQQAWFGSKPAGYDASFRHPDEDDIPLLVATAAPQADSHSKTNEIITEEGNSVDSIDSLANDDSSESLVLKRRVSALVALHPDEATGEIVEQAVKHRIPFVVVPCCVFARLFPHRTTKDGRPVSSYEDLLDFLQEQDPSIQRTQLSFGGKNIALWSVFPDG